MTYDNIVHGIFLRRLNRFVCEVQVNGEVFPAHVRNTGRCTGVIAAGAEVSLQRSTDSSRKTPFTLIAVSTPQYGWVNIDSLAPNVMAGEWLSKQGFELIHPEHEFGESRIDFYMERSEERYIMEVKGCTLAENGVGLLYNNNDEEQIPAEITELIEKRKEARKAKDFALADSIRDQIKELGWVVEETRQGTIVKKA